MKTKIIRTVLICALLTLIVGSIAASALVPYQTYTYDVYGDPLKSPHAYVPLKIINSGTIKESYLNGSSENTQSKYQYTDITNLNNPKDIFVDDLNRVYIADTDNNRIVVLDENYNFCFYISTFVNDQGVPDSLSGPEGIYVTESEIYVADTQKSRIVVFDKLGNFNDIVPEPSSDVMPDGSIYKPVALAVDKSGRLYVVSSTTHYGVISLNRDGSFNSFIGPQAVSGSVWTRLLRMFQTAEQIAASTKLVPTEYNNVTIDSDGFLYITTSTIADSDVISAINGRSKSGKYAPVKKLNPTGSDVMVRNGFWPPSGEINFSTMSNADISGPSKLVDVALGPNNTWSVIDQKRSKVYTYDENGNLLFAFGDFGDQMGNIQSLTAIAYQGTNILLLDKTTQSITVYKRTDYGDLIAAAIQKNADKQYDEAVNYYMSILQHNNNYDTAYVGIGQSLYRNGEYYEAMQYFKYAYDTEDYSEAYQLYRKEWIEQNLWVLPVVVIGAIFLISKLFGWANKVNKRGQKFKEKRKFYEEILYGFHVMLHPFDGFWDLKHEKRGSVRGATFWLAVTVVVFVYQSVGRGYLFNPYNSTTSFLFTIISVALPLFLWVTANWCLTTLFEGEGSFKDVYIATCYSLVPLVLLILPTTIISNFVIADEMEILTMIDTLAFWWMALLVIFGMMVTHDYGIVKNILTVLGTIVGVAFIIFIVVLFGSLIRKVYTFFYNIYIELKLRA